ncbi:DUF1524 domain-containing protein [Streptomyces sp. NPDC005355]|uniref:HNH endonuclease family protein n=1 Tax=Streptomyces sp. NPDC005355 TaxID=3157038 RepID=UPI0033A0B4DB
MPLAEAWDSGASAWTAALREAYANDQGTPTSLIAVSGSSNRSKSDKDPADWLPVEGFRCEYASAWVATKLRWQLPADPAERDALTAWRRPALTRRSATSRYRSDRGRRMTPGGVPALGEGGRGRKGAAPPGQHERPPHVTADSPAGRKSAVEQGSDQALVLSGRRGGGSRPPVGLGCDSAQRAARCAPRGVAS